MVYPYPYGSDNPDDTVFDCDYEFPKTVLLLYDQEPFWSSVRWLDHWAELFKQWGSTVILITTQGWGTNLDNYVQKYNWIPVCYQHHYMAARDWYRGYRNHPLRQRVDQRCVTNHFSCYNRLFAENRPHRLQLLADLYDNDLLVKTAISFPAHDPLTNQTYASVTGRNDIQNILPLVIDDAVHSNNSHSIDIETANTCAVQLVTETVFDINENYLSEKIYKPMVLRQPFVVFGPPRVLETLHNMGYKTFSTFWPERYDDIIDHDARYSRTFDVVKTLGLMHINEIEDVLHDKRMQQVLEHNHQWFYMQHTLDGVVNGLLRDIESVIPA